MSSNAKTPDQWDAEDHIANLKKFLYQMPATPDTNLCKAHTEVLIWIVRRLDLSPRTGFEFALALFKVSPAALLSAALLLIVVKYTGMGL